MSLPDLGKLMAQAREMQSQMERIGEELKRERFEGSAGAGMVRAVASGELRIVEIEIEPSLIAGDDRAMLQDLTAAAVNDALAAAQRGVQERMQQVTGGIPIPGLGGAGGLGGPGR